MRIGPIKRNGYTMHIVLSSQDAEIDLRMQTHEAGELVSRLLLELAEAEPLQWQEVHVCAREAERRLTPRM